MEDGLKWRFTGIYGHPVLTQRHHSWNLLRHLHTLSSLPWVVVGDFNEITHSLEKSGGLERYLTAMDDFCIALGDCGVTDIGFDGPLYTWTNKHQHPNLIQERLDGVVVTVEWRDMFCDARVLHDDFYGSDHRLLRLNLSQQSALVWNQYFHSFRFEPLWRIGVDFKEVIGDCWTHNLQGPLSTSDELSIKLAHCAMFLKRWGNRHFGYIPRQVRFLQDQISILNTSPDAQSSHMNVINLEKRLDCLLALEEYYWKQRSRIDWLKGGDQNTKFFHNKANIRRRNNRIQVILSSNNGCVTDQHGVSSIFEEFFEHLFTSSSPSFDSISRGTNGLTGRNSESMRLSLDASFSSDDISKALFQIGHWKAPGLDGFHAGFVQEN